MVPSVSKGGGGFWRFYSGFTMCCYGFTMVLLCVAMFFFFKRCFTMFWRAGGSWKLRSRAVKTARKRTQLEGVFKGSVGRRGAIAELHSWCYPMQSNLSMEKDKTTLSDPEPSSEPKQPSWLEAEAEAVTPATVVIRASRISRPAH